MSPSEAILCIARDALPAAWLGEMAAIPMAEKAFYDRVPGSVHLGLVFCLDVDESERLVPGEELFRFRWVTKTELDGLKLEHWSRLSLGLTG